jgi:hypothetical protein
VPINLSLVEYSRKLQKLASHQKHNTLITSLRIFVVITITAKPPPPLVDPIPWWVKLKPPMLSIYIFQRLMFRGIRSHHIMIKGDSQTPCRMVDLIHSISRLSDHSTFRPILLDILHFVCSPYSFV